VTKQEFLDVLTRLLGETEWPKPLHLLLGLTLLERGGDVGTVARAVGTTQRLLQDVQSASDPVQRVLGLALHEVFRTNLERIMNAEWYVLSARRADKLLRALLFDRVFALRVRNFARAFGRAELDMHFSLSGDLIPLRQYLATLREEGPQKITTLLERGEY
jgi:hypothetical protein